MEPSVDVEAIITDPAASADVAALHGTAREFSAYPDTIARLV